MSGQWEVVGKKKDKGNNKIIDQKTGKETSKRKTENLNVKVEEVLAKSQVKSLYSNDKNKENKPVEKKAQEGGGKKNQKKQEKVQEPPKVKSPKSIESALNQISAEEFNSIFEKSKSHFPDAPIVWLKELAQFLNQKIHLELQDPVFTTKPKNYPLSAVPSGIKSVFEKATKDAEKNNVQLFFDISLTSMATDMSKNLPAIGHKLLLQYIALTEPELVVANIMKHTVLRNSYQNRPNIGLSILWAVAQTGINDFQSGFTVFQELMLPLIELRNYSKFIIQYLLDLISDVKNVSIKKEQYLLILDTALSNKKNFPADLKQNLIAAIPSLKCSLFHKSTDSVENMVDLYLKKLPLNDNTFYQDCLCDVLIECFSRNPSSLENWSRIHSKNVTTSAILLRYIDKNWETISSKIQLKALESNLREIVKANEELTSRRRKEEFLTETVDISKKLLEKMANRPKSRSSSKFLFYILVLTILGLIYFDIKKQGSWQKSNSKRLLKEYGVEAYMQVAYNKISQGLSWIDGNIEETFPGYHKKLGDFTGPYVELGRNLGRIFYNIGVNIKEIISEKYPVIVQSIESYAPGLMEQSQNAVNTVWTSSVLYFNRSIDYLKKEVFVGQLSPENMQRVVFEALNTTQIKATEYYHWLYEKVQTTIK